MKRSVSLLFVFALLLAACGDAEPEQAAEQTTTTVVETTTTIQAPPTTAAPTTGAEPATRTVTHMLGDTEVPLEIERWVVLDEYAALSLFTLGIEPTVVFASYGTAVAAAILEAEGIPLQESALGSANVSLEVLVSFEPDVIVGTWDAGIDAIYEDLSAIAPTVILPFVEPWRDVLSATGLYFQKEEEAARVVAVIEERIAEVSVLVADDPKSVSILGAFGEMAFTPANEIPLSRIVVETGLTRSAVQAGAPADPTFSYIVPLSAEVLVDHDADEILLLTGTVYGTAEPITSTPTFQSLSAVEAGNVTMVSGEMWFGTFGFAVFWILADLQAIVSGEGAVGTDADAHARWSDFQARLAG